MLKVSTLENRRGARFATQTARSPSAVARLVFTLGMLTLLGACEETASQPNTINMWPVEAGVPGQLDAGGTPGLPSGDGGTPGFPAAGDSAIGVVPDASVPGKTDAATLGGGDSATAWPDAAASDAAASDAAASDAAVVVDAGDAGGSVGNPDSGTPGTPPAVVSGCGNAKLYASNDTDPGALGPWPVGVKTLKVPAGSATLTVEVWYPAKFGSDQGKTKQAYDLREWLPKGAVMIPDSVNKLAVCDCYRDLPLDTDHGPYPAVLYVHGLGSMRVASYTTMQTWASHGFIVVAADHPGDMLTDFLAGFGVLSSCQGSGADPGDMQLEANAVLSAMNGKSSGFDFFGASMDLTRMALGGHSQGGGAVSSMANTPNVKVIITLAPLGGGALNAPVESMLQVTGTIDSVTGYSTDAYRSDRSKLHRHVGIKNAGHIDVTDLCKEKNPQGKTAIQVASDEGVCGALILSGLAQCGGDAMATPVSPLIVNYATTAALEETLQCKNRAAAWSGLQAKYPQVSEFLHTP